jgi:hypothetical protein
MGNIIDFKDVKKRHEELTDEVSLDEREIVAQRLEFLADLYREGSISNIDMIFDNGPEGSECSTLIFSSTEKDDASFLLDRIFNGLNRVVFEDEF